MEKVSVIVATMDRQEELIRCLRSVINQGIPPHEIVVVDDGALDVKAVRKEIPPGTLFQYHRKSPPGLSASRNLGARVARGDLFLFLDDDVVLEPGFIEEILEVFQEDSAQDVGGVCGVVLNRRSKPSLFPYWARIFLMDRGRQGEILPWGFYTKILRPDRVLDVDWIPGGLSCFRKEVFSEFQLSDLGQAGRHGLADLEFSWRVSRRFRLKATPFARLHHYHSRHAREKHQETGYKQALNHCLLFDVHGEKTLRNWLCFSWAMTGLILGNVGAAVVARKAPDRQAWLLRGLGNIKGIRAYFRDRHPLRLQR